MDNQASGEINSNLMSEWNQEQGFGNNPTGNNQIDPKLAGKNNYFK